MSTGQSPRAPTIVRLGRSYSGEETNFLANLRRTNTSQPWGFRMLGGRDQGSCLYIHKVNPKSIAEKNGIRPGDGIMAISGAAANGMTHDQAKMEILRAGNELDLYLSRNAMPVTSEIVKRQQSIEEQNRAEIVDDPSFFDTGYQNPNVQSRSFKILQEALSYTEAPDDASLMKNEPSAVMRNEPPRYLRNEPPPIMRNDPSTVMRNVSPGELLSITDILNLTGYS